MRICVGQILGAHGVRGLVKLASFTADPGAIGSYGALTDEAGARRFGVTLMGAQKSHFLARIDGIADRDAAHGLTGTRLFVERAQLPPPAADEFYHADLIGLRAELPDGSVLGNVVALHNFGAGDIVELALAGGKQPMIPFDRATVPTVDFARGVMVVDPAPGLLDDALLGDAGPDEGENAA
jgi:16S rRNA processing protein RimM